MLVDGSQSRSGGVVRALACDRLSALQASTHVAEEEAAETISKLEAQHQHTLVQRSVLVSTASWLIDEFLASSGATFHKSSFGLASLL